MVLVGMTMMMMMMMMMMTTYNEALMPKDAIAVAIHRTMPSSHIERRRRES